MIEPVVGRHVWYRPHSGDPLGGESAYPDRRYAAIIAHVWTNSCVNLAVFDPNGECFNRTSVELVQDGAPCEPGRCEWMPYQIAADARDKASAAVADAAIQGYHRESM